jgi:sulfur transfer complex TusBCD TusB component (DsrH family)
VTQQIIRKDPLARAIQTELKQDDLFPQDTKQSWEDLDRIYEKCGEAIIAIGNSVNTALAYPGILEHVNNVPELKLSVITLKNDLENFTGELLAIKARHANKFGYIEDENDLADSISIFEDYVSFSSKFQTITTPTLINIIEKVSFATEALKQQSANQNATIGE